MRRGFFYFLLAAGITYSFSLFALQEIQKQDPAAVVQEADSEYSQFNFDNALQKYQEGIDLYQRKNDKQGMADTYYKLGSMCSLISKYPEASNAFDKALKLHEELQDRKNIGEDLSAIARIQFLLAEYDKSLATANKALAIHKEVGNKKGIATTYGTMGSVHDLMGDYKKALDFARLSLEISTEIDDKEGSANGRSLRGQVYWKQGNLDLAIEEYETVLSIAEEIKDLRIQGRAHGNIGLVYWHKGDMELALEHTGKSLLIAKQTGNRRSESTNHFNSALMLMEQGNYHQALEKFQKSLSMAQEQDDKGLVSVCLEGMGKLYKYFGDYERALEYYKRSYVIAKEIGEKRAEAYAVAAMGYVYEHDQKYAMAIESFQKASLLYKEMDEKRGIAKMHESIGQVRLDMKKYDEALKDFYASLSILESIGAKYEMPETYRMIGLAYENKKQLGEAENALSKAIELAREIDLPNTLWSALHWKGIVIRESGRPDEALPLLTESIDVVEKMRTQLTDVEQRAGYLEERLVVYEDTIELLVASNKIPQAFEYVQRSKARAFLDMLAEAQVDSDSGLNPDLRDRRHKILADLMKSQKNLGDEKGKESLDRAKINQLQNKQKQLEQEYGDLILEIRNANPMYAEVQYPQPLKLVEAQALLDDQTLLLEYFLGSSGSLLFVVSRDNVDVFTLKGEQELAKLVNEVREVIMKPDPVYDASQKTYSRYVNLAYALYTEILKPAESILQNKLRVVIAPDGVLNYLPFESLLITKVKTDRINFSNLPYLARDFEIDYVPSISVLASIGKKNDNDSSSQQKELLAFADPVLKGVAAGSKASEETRNVRSWAGTLTPLPHAREEVEGIARLYSKDKVTVVMGKDASESNLKKMNLQDYRKIHFASHGLIDEEKPQFSALLLTGESGQGEDGFLTMREVFDLKLNADLVVLSACKSGLGKEIRGEGITGISRAFLCAGTTSVIVSLWDVYDMSTADLMTSFYKNLETKGLNKAAALRAARLEMIQNQKYSHPYYWAPFVLIGQR